jgi:hypothetical protein
MSAFYSLYSARDSLAGSPSNSLLMLTIPENYVAYYQGLHTVQGQIPEECFGFNSLLDVVSPKTMT